MNCICQPYCNGPMSNDMDLTSDDRVAFAIEQAVPSGHGVQDAVSAAEVVAFLEKAGILESRSLCLELVAELAERVGYESAGDVETTIVSELMLMSARASQLAKRVSEPDQT